MSTGSAARCTVSSAGSCVVFASAFFRSVPLFAVVSVSQFAGTRLCGFVEHCLGVGEPVAYRLLGDSVIEGDFGDRVATGHVQQLMNRHASVFQHRHTRAAIQVDLDPLCNKCTRAGLNIQRTGGFCHGAGTLLFQNSFRASDLFGGEGGRFGVSACGCFLFFIGEALGSNRLVVGGGGAAFGVMGAVPTCATRC